MTVSRGEFLVVVKQFLKWSMKNLIWNQILRMSLWSISKPKLKTIEINSLHIFFYWTTSQMEVILRRISYIESWTPMKFDFLHLPKIIQFNVQYCRITVILRYVLYVLFLPYIIYLPFIIIDFGCRNGNSEGEFTLCKKKCENNMTGKKQ